MNNDEKVIKKGFLLGLDASSKIIGFCVFDKEKEVINELNSYSIKVERDILLKAQEFEIWLESLLVKWPKINEIVIEESFQAMYGTTSDAHTIALLNQVNALYRYICYQKGLKVNTLSVSAARGFCFPTYSFQNKKKSGGKNHKQQAFGLVLKEIGDIYFPIKIISRGKNKGEVRFEETCYDMSDSYILVRAYMNKLSGIDPKAIKKEIHKIAAKNKRKAAKDIIKY